jgi:hypothetical protein
MLRTLRCRVRKIVYEQAGVPIASSVCAPLETFA